jgi:hypothetical protein
VQLSSRPIKVPNTSIGWMVSLLTTLHLSVLSITFDRLPNRPHPGRTFGIFNLHPVATLLLLRFRGLWPGITSKATVHCMSDPSVKWPNEVLLLTFAYRAVMWMGGSGSPSVLHVGNIPMRRNPELYFVCQTQFEPKTAHDWPRERLCVTSFSVLVTRVLCTLRCRLPWHESLCMQALAVFVETPHTSSTFYPISISTEVFELDSW